MSSSAVAPSPLPPSILLERPEHARAVEVLVDRAFGPGRFAKSSERLREGNRKLDDCSFVALSNEWGHEGRVIGSVRLWPVRVGDKAVAFLGPLAVDADERKHGLGQALVEAACAAAAKAGWRAVLLVGDAPYFGRIGFSAEPAAQATMPGPADQRRVLVKALVEGGDAGLAGPIRLP
ncbi:GNAT family N-acetyltransferase [Caulobacter rhizosphaerae]|jgi:predicted N-acetyltransferase YhbS|uniref:GNAT family N-acetyltransferase n=1 Tax=Caulobacter rhizosphaerae TaxID=2010972 RepID=UPI0013D13A46|nr:N-acetyltransferase [Caulobacter rhizosphaerae]GGL34537.1 N-acetyltransferase [Caulobacter rhizosphaerae]